MSNSSSVYLKILALIIAILCLLALYFAKVHSYYLADISPHQAQALITEDVFFIDVRSKPEYQQGHPQASINIPLYFLKANRSVKNDHFLTDVTKLANIQSTSSIIFTCQSGSRSHQAANVLAKAGYRQVYNMQGGFELWYQQKLPSVLLKPKLVNAK